MIEKSYLRESLQKGLANNVVASSGIHWALPSISITTGSHQTGTGATPGAGGLTGLIN